MSDDDVRAGADLRMPALGVAAWLAALVVLTDTAWLVPLVATGALAGVLVLVRSGARQRATVAGVLLVAAGSTAVAGLHVTRLGHGPLPALAAEGATVEATLVVTSDPRLVRGRYADRALLRGSVREVEGRGRAWALRAPVVVLADPGWRRLELGATVRVAGRLAEADGDVAAMLVGRGRPVPVAAPGPWWRGADRVRDSLRASVAGRPEAQRALVPALVVGDDSRLDPELAEDFRATGLTHLLAVSGTNLTLLVGFLLVLARWCGVRGRWMLVVAGAGIVGFVLLARTEPSVVRAATMGTVALLGLGRNGLRRGTRGLGVAVVVLLLLDPWLAVSPGFALSVLATAGILLLAPTWRDAMARWLPRWLAEAVSVPAAAQLACTPVVAALSGEVSLVAVVANLLAAPAVGPATVLGLAGGLVGLLLPPLAAVLGTLAGWCVGWIVLVARHGSALPTASVEWGTGPVSLALLVGCCLAAVVVAPALLARRATGLACAGLVALAVLVRPPTPGWPADGWVLAACDVGQGDALVLRAARRQAVVVDAGPDPGAVDRCLRRLGVDAVPLLVLSHHHADHVDGLPGVLRGRRVGAAVVSPLPEPAAGAAEVSRLLAGAGVPARLLPPGTSLRVGQVRLQALGPAATPSSYPSAGGDGAGEEGSAANDASVVLLVVVRGVRVLLTGDVEPTGQAGLAAAAPGLRVDVLKVPHHGSRHQDLDFLLGLGARVAVVPVGEGNGYGHPSRDVLAPLRRTGATVLRTDRDGDVLVAEEDGRLTVHTRR